MYVNRYTFLNIKMGNTLELYNWWNLDIWIVENS